jgi:hypothetical protein
MSANIKELIKQKRDSLSNSSLTTYASILKNLHKKVFDDKTFSLSDFDETEKVLDYLKDVPPNKRKTILSALVIVSSGKVADDYRTKMNEDVSAYNAEIQKQTKSETQRENWVETSEIQEIFRNLENDAKALYKKTNKSVSDLQAIQNYIIVALLGGMFIAPRRSLDYVNFKIKNIDREKDNYLDKNKLVFNSYKTFKTYGRQEVEIPKTLKSILTKWIKLNPSEYLLFDGNMNQLSSVKLNQRMNRIFGNRAISVNAMRHTYLTDKYKKTSEENKQLSEDMTNMASSIDMAPVYIKLK